MYETTMTMVGRMATAVSQVTFDDGGVKATFRLASAERRFDRGLQQWVDGSRLFLTVICWRVLAERVLATLSVGDPVIAMGRLRAREYEKDGRVHAVVELEATAVGPDLTRCSAVVARRSAPSVLTERGQPVEHAAGAMAPAASATSSTTSVTGSPSPGPRATPAADDPDDGVEWNGGPLVREYLEHDDHVPTEEHWPDEAAVRA